jgi:molybdenum-dependent DNA-binding transcriptional regulator ModE
LLVAALPLSAQAQDMDHARAWSALLARMCACCAAARPAQVDYAGLASRPRGAEGLSGDSSVGTARGGLQGLAAQGASAMAFLINAYNAFTVELILTRYPT